MLCFGLCSVFSREPIRFRQTTAKALSTLSRSRQIAKLSEICRANAESFLAAVQAVSRMGIGAFRVLSPIFPRYTHPDVAYELDDLPEAAAIRGLLASVSDYRTIHDIRLSFHPDQFVTLSSPRDDAPIEGHTASLYNSPTGDWIACLYHEAGDSIHCTCQVPFSAGKAAPR